MDTSAADPPRHRSIVVVDIEGSTARTNPARAQLRTVLFDLLDEAFRAGGITADLRDAFIDRGDGAICLVRPADEAPKTALLAHVVPALAQLLARHAGERPELAFRLRVAVHAGEVHYDSRGVYGEDLDLACRLVDAAETKRQLRNSSQPLVLVVSGEFHRAVIRHGYAGIDRSAFAPVVNVRLGEQKMRGWIGAMGAEIAS